MARKPGAGSTPKPKQVEALQHAESRVNIPTAEMQSFFEREEDHAPRPPTRYARQRPLGEGETRERDGGHDPQIVWNGARITLTEAQRKKLAETGEIEIGDAQLVWRGKDTQDWSDLVVSTPPLYIQEKIHPKAIVADLKRRSAASADAATDAPDLFADFNGIPREASTEFYQHDQHWSNRMILGDSLSVMASLAERERLKGKVQCIYFDPPYGIKFNSNWQVSTRSRDVKDGKQTDISREPEQVKAFRDTWKDGIHSYLTYLRDRLTVMRDLLTESGSVFVQIGDENVHRVRAVMDEVFGSQQFCREIVVLKASAQSSRLVPSVSDFLLWYCKDINLVKSRELFSEVSAFHNPTERFVCVETPEGKLIDLSVAQKTGQSRLPKGRVCRLWPTFSQTGGASSTFEFVHQQSKFSPPSKYGWQTTQSGLRNLAMADRLASIGKSLRWKVYHDNFPYRSLNNVWSDLRPGGFGEDRNYVVQTDQRVIARCLLMTTDPGDLILDPTCGSGTASFVAEQWGRRWITIDTSRVALAIARTRLMAARYPYYILADSVEGQRKEAELTGRMTAGAAPSGDIRQSFVFERVPRISLRSIANNSRIESIWSAYQSKLEPLRDVLNNTLKEKWEEWQIPREAEEGWHTKAIATHSAWWQLRVARQKDIDDAIAKAADVEMLYDKPYRDDTKVRVTGPFTVESLSPHRIIASDEGEGIDEWEAADGTRTPQVESNPFDRTTPQIDFSAIVIEYLKTSGVHQSDKSGRITFDTVTPWPGKWIGAEGRFAEGETPRRAAILIGPEYGTVSRPDLVAAAREANDNRFDLLIACAFNFDAHSSELTQLGPLRVLKARMNPDMHMAGELKNTGKGNLFVVFGEPDIEIDTLDNGDLKVRVNGVDVYDPNTGDIRSNDTRDIAAWFIDTDYNEESFFVRHAYFLGANDPYKALKSALRADIDEEAWATLYSAESRPFLRPRDGVIAVKVINHFGDEVMKVYRV